MLKHAIEKGANFHRSDSFAAGEGHLNCLKYILEHKPASSLWPPRIKTIECLQYLMEKCGREATEKASDNIWKSAVAHSIEYIQFMLDNKIPLPEKTFHQDLLLRQAVGSIDILKFMMDVVKLSFTEDGNPLIYAARPQNLEVMKFIVDRNLHIQNPEIDRVIQSAISSKNVDVLKYVWDLYPNKEKVALEERANEAVANCPPEILAFLTERGGMQWTSKHLDVASQNETYQIWHT